MAGAWDAAPSIASATRRVEASKSMMALQLDDSRAPAQLRTVGKSGAPGGGRTFELTGWRGGSRAAFLRFPGRVRKESRLPWHHV